MVLFAAANGRVFATANKVAADFLNPYQFYW
jgi:hypothetical protein